MGQIRYITKNFGKTNKPFEYRNRRILTKFETLKLAEPVPGKPHSQWRVMMKTVDPEVVKRERKLPSLSESMPPYAKTSAEQIKRFQSYGTFYDSKFNPHLFEGRNEVSPDEEPFNAIYADSTSEDSNQYTNVRNIATPELWEYVERLARLTIAPEPPLRKAGDPIMKMPSGFVPPPETPPDLPYFISRTRNYILPVYYNLDKDPEECYTKVRQITGDIWKLEEDLRTYLQSVQEGTKRILTSVHETDGTIRFRGKHLQQAVEWLHSKGF